MNFIELRDLSHLISYYPKLSVGGEIFEIQRRLIDPSAITDRLVYLNKHGVVIDPSSRRAWFHSQDFPFILTGSQSPRVTIDEEQLALGMIIPSAAEGTHPQLVFRNNVRYNFSDTLTLEIESTASNPINLSLRVEESEDLRTVIADADSLAVAQINVTASKNEGTAGRVDPSPQLGVFQQQTGVQWNEYVITLLPNLPAEFTSLGVTRFILDPGPAVQTCLSEFMEPISVIQVHDVSDKSDYSANDVVNAYQGVPPIILLHLFNGNIYRDASGEQPGWFGFAHLSRAFLNDASEEITSSSQKSDSISVPGPIHEDVFLYQVKNPIGHSNGIGTVDDLLVPVAKLPHRD